MLYLSKRKPSRIVWFYLWAGRVYGKGDKMSNGEINNNVQKIRTGFVLSLVVLGTAAVAVSLGAEILGIDLTPGFGIVQTVQLLAGLSLLTIAGYTQIYFLRNVNEPRSLQADVGLRLGATGLVLSYLAGLSDIIGVGTHLQPLFERPFVGPLQLTAMGFSVFLIVVGLLLYFTSRGNQASSSLEFLLEE